MLFLRSILTTVTRSSCSDLFVSFYWDLLVSLKKIVSHYLCMILGGKWRWFGYYFLNCLFLTATNVVEICK